MTQRDGVRARRRAEREAEILRVGKEHLARYGAAGLSLRAVARDLGLASSAVYRYVADRDALLTLLLVDAYADLARFVEQTVEDGPAEPAARMRAFAEALHQWGRRHPDGWGLLYGAPVPGYAAPPERTTGPGTRLMALLARLVADLHTTGTTTASPAATADDAGTAAIEPPLHDYLVAGASELGVAASPESMAHALGLWSALIGAVSLDVFGQLGTADEQVGRDLVARIVRDHIGRL
jgi:AcrR family transcriptional regulator